MMKLSLEQ